MERRAATRGLRRTAAQREFVRAIRAELKNIREARRAQERSAAGLERIVSLLRAEIQKTQQAQTQLSNVEKNIDEIRKGAAQNVRG